LVLKLNETFGEPQLNFYIKRRDGSVEEVKKLIDGSIFKEYFDSFDVFESTDKENHKSLGKIKSEFACIITGLKCYLSENSKDLIDNVSEDFFNIDAKPFKPKKVQ
jgi:hypothetical protein